KENNEKYSYILESGFDSYDNLYNYMLETSKKTIHWILTRGISYNGIKIKLRS
ncbi:TPA: Imm9 family immunity protein, partial [Salmonella enterica subsp. enterica serovar Weltevreden]